MSEKIWKPEDIRDEIVAFFKNRSLIPIVGAGLTCGIQSKNGYVPTGEQYKLHMLAKIEESKIFTDEEFEDIKTESFSHICDYYEDDEIVNSEERFAYWKECFSGVSLKDDYRESFLKIDWPYIYSLNVDDAIENSSSFNHVVLPNRQIREEILNDKKCVLKMHGDVNELLTYKNTSKIFSTKEYAVSIENNSAILDRLRNDFKGQNILFLGCSLTDEMDLKTIDILPVDYHTKENYRKTIIFIKGNPDRRQLSKFKSFGITDIICFDKYEDMYTFLFETWEEAQKIQNGELDFYTSVPQSTIPAIESEENCKYFFFGKSLFNNKAREIKIPYFFLQRNITKEILQNIGKNKVHLINGRRLSGKSYCLVDLYISIKDRITFYFDGRTRLSQEAMNALLNKKNIVALFDVGAVSKEQFETILQNAKKINQNGNDFVVCLNTNDSDSLGVVKWKLRQKYIDDSDIISYEINNKLEEDDEIKEINTKYPVVKLPPYKEKKSFIDQIMYAEDVLDVKSKYSQLHIKVTNEKQLALLILLAIKEKLYSLEVINYRLESEIIDALKRYDPLIERLEVCTFEKENSDLSSVKYLVNSRYWLRRELGEYARKEENRIVVADAYMYIISCVIRFTSGDENKQREICRDLVRFDIMNDIFLDKYKGNIRLTVCIYERLYTILAGDFNFLHQNAKCLLNYFYYAKEEKKKNDLLEKALRLAILSREMVEQKISKNNNEKLCISQAHVIFTIAVIYSEMCREEEYKDFEKIEKTLVTINEAWTSPYNDIEKKRDKNNIMKRGTARFIFELIDNVDVTSLTKKSQDIYSEVIAGSIM